MKTTILVTGATGTVGHGVVKALGAMKDVQVRAFVRNAAKAQSLEGPNVAITQGDLAKKDTIEKALQGVDKVFLLSNADPKQMELQGNVVEAAKKTHVKHIVKLSALGTSLDSPIKLAQWHRQTEEHIEKSGIPYTHLHPHFFMQNFFMFAQTIKKDGAFYAPMKEAKMSMVDTRDIAHVAATVLTQTGHEGKTYDITGPEAVSFNEAAAKLSEVLGKQVKYVPISIDDLKKGMKSMGIEDWFVEDMAKLYEFFNSGKAAFVTPTVLQVTKKPGHSFSQFVKDYTQNFK